MEAFKFFNFCPKCGQHRVGPKAQHPFECAACGFLYYFNPAIAAAAFVVRPDGRVLFIRRAKDPARGKLAIPGGFVDFGETAEEAVRREMWEEVQLRIASSQYLGSFLNEYLFREVTYPVLDLFFIVTAEKPESATARDDVESLAWMIPGAVDLQEIAFPSIRAALETYRLRAKTG